ncbi:unnamed protein product [Caenorhabditis angaria]|uniref:G-protein coupled receptors family 1 profile domain-containing protein n=1 Tax=Caenorhabditis angaria TaxID=860376 RepID=A0A9P1MWA5_9PELO|nr:unnamed protein product [Caenorhabditis angaria]
MPKIFLITECIALFAAALSTIINAFIIFVFFTKRISTAENLRLPLYLAIGDIGYAIASLIHVGYLAYMWNDTYFDYSPEFIIYTNSFLPAHLKIVVVVSLGMAFDRVLAIYWPVFYRQTSRTTYANLVFVLGFVWFQFDYWFQMLTPDFVHHPNCPTMACFVNKKFLIYVSYSNTICGILIVIMSIFVFIGLHKISRKKSSSNTQSSTKAVNIFQQANRITVGILFASLFFVTIPSLLVTLYEEITGVSLFAELGPFYIAAILVNGVADGLVFLILNIKHIGFKTQSRSNTLNPTTGKEIAAMSIYEKTKIINVQ